jgi:DNA-binding MarR family transcriptional regulator
MDSASFGLVLGGGSLLHQVGRELGTAMDREFAAYGLTAQQAAVLLHAAREPTSPSQLRAQLGTDTAGMTKLLDRLAAKGLIERRPHPGDRRAIVIELTAAGRELLPNLPPVFGRVSSALLAGFAPTELATLTGMLNRMLANLRPIA